MINTEIVAHSTRGRIAILSLDNPPVNGLGHALRQALVAALDDTEHNSNVTAVILCGSGKLFCGGADVREFGTAKSTASPHLREVLARLFAYPKPIVAAINGAAFGGGLELAMACNYRVAQPQAVMALPEVKLGLIPGAWGTQLLPRLVGIEAAVDMVTRGKPVDAEHALRLGLVDRVAADTAIAEAVALLASMGEQTQHPDTRRRRVQPPAGDVEAFFERARNEIERREPGCPAPLAGLEAVRLALTQPFEEAIARERQFFVTLMQSPESSALRHVFFAERDASRVPNKRLERVDTPALEIRPASVGHENLDALLQELPTVSGKTHQLQLKPLAAQAGGPDTTIVTCALADAEHDRGTIACAIAIRNARPACIEIACPDMGDDNLLAQVFALARALSPVIVATRAEGNPQTPLLPELAEALFERTSASREHHGIARTDTFDEVTRRAKAALVDRRLLREADADVLAIHALGYLRHLGGPLYQAGRLGESSNADGGTHE